MKIADLAKHWEGPVSHESRPNDYRLRLPLEDAARIAALAELYPNHSEADILNDMVSAALNEASNTRQLKPMLASRNKPK